MAYTKVRLASRVEKEIQSWALPDRIQIELFLYLTRVLPADIGHNLMRAAFPFDGMVAHCERRDPYVKDRDHFFDFLVYFGQDEQTLFIARGVYLVT
jgi:hypothetical protein